MIQSDCKLILAFDFGEKKIGIASGNLFTKTASPIRCAIQAGVWPGDAIVFDVKCSQALEDMIHRYGGTPVMWKTGHSLIKDKRKELNVNFDTCFTSYLKRAINTLDIVLKILGKNKKYTKAWELNERHYGALTGLNKAETKKKLGEEQFKKYRRSWDIPPPPIQEDSKYLSNFSPLNGSIPIGMTPFTESLKDTYERVIPYFKKNISDKLNKNIIIAAHGNSIRALCKHLFNIDNEKISKLEIPTGNPLLIKFDNNKKVREASYLDKKRANDLIIFN